MIKFQALPIEEVTLDTQLSKAEAGCFESGTIYVPKSSFGYYGGQRPLISAGFDLYVRKMIALWSIEGNVIKVNLKGKNTIAQQVVKLFPEENRDAIYDKSFSLPLENWKEDSINQFILNSLNDKLEKVLESEKRAYYDKYDKMISENNRMEVGMNAWEN